jgi:polyisoprenoid-binding protein YceI
VNRRNLLRTAGLQKIAKDSGFHKEITLPVTAKGPIKGPWGNNRMDLHGWKKLNPNDYCVKYNHLLETGGAVVGDEVEIGINAEATRPAPK